MPKPIFRAITPYHVLLRAPLVAAHLPTVDLRPTIESLGLGVRSQGGRGTCSVFAMTFMQEYMYGSRLNVRVELSEEYLNYVANLTTGNTGDGDFFSNLDAGYKAWGVAPESSLPYAAAPVGTVPQSLLDDGRRWTRFKADFIKPWDNQNGASQAQLERTLARLDDGIPVARR